jgi:iron complex outermembrane recepter protein
VSATWRYFDAVDLDRTSTNPQLARSTANNLTDLRFGSRSYLDLTGSITFAENYTLRVGANNVTDKDPPLVGQANCPAGPCNGNAFAQTYDVLGRQWFATVTVDF